MKIKNVLVMYLTQTYYIVNILRSSYTLVNVQRRTRGTRYCQLHMQSINSSAFYYYACHNIRGTSFAFQNSGISKSNFFRRRRVSSRAVFGAHLRELSSERTSRDATRDPKKLLFYFHAMMYLGYCDTHSLITTVCQLF